MNNLNQKMKPELLVQQSSRSICHLISDKLIGGVAVGVMAVEGMRSGGAV